MLLASLQHPSRHLPLHPGPPLLQRQKFPIKSEPPPKTQQYLGVSKNRGGTPKWMVIHKGKPYEHG